MHPLSLPGGTVGVQSIFVEPSVTPAPGAVQMPIDRCPVGAAYADGAATTIATTMTNALRTTLILIGSPPRSNTAWPRGLSRRRARPQSRNVSRGCRTTPRRSVNSSDQADENGRKTRGAHQRSRRESSEKLTIRPRVAFLRRSESYPSWRGSGCSAAHGRRTVRPIVGRRRSATRRRRRLMVVAAEVPRQKSITARGSVLSPWPSQRHDLSGQRRR